LEALAQQANIPQLDTETALSLVEVIIANPQLQQQLQQALQQ
jgi:hypothetical protein